MEIDNTFTIHPQPLGVYVRLNDKVASLDDRSGFYDTSLDSKDVRVIKALLENAIAELDDL